MNSLTDTPMIRDYSNNWSNKHPIFILLLLGFSSGLPLALTASTLQAWFTTVNIDILAIGFLTLVGQPYAYKFLWAPLMDRYSLPLLGHRRGWIFLTQSMLLIAISSMAILHPAESTISLGFLALFICFLSASQDVVIDAYRTELLPSGERSVGAAIFLTGYRIAMLTSGALALILADYIGWHLTYFVMGGCMLVGMFATLFAPEPQLKKPQSIVKTSESLLSAFITPLYELWNRQAMLGILIFVTLYKLGDAFAATLITNFLLKELGFSLTIIGTAYKTVGLFSTLLGAFIGGILLTKLRLYPSLMLFGILQAFAILAYMGLAIIGQHYWIMVTVIFVANFFSGMATNAFIVLLMTLCNQQYTAAQYALLAALASIARIFVGPLASVIVQQVGWVDFFFFSFLTSIPGLIVLYFLKNLRIFQVHSETDSS